MESNMGKTVAVGIASQLSISFLLSPSSPLLSALAGPVAAIPLYHSFKAIESWNVIDGIRSMKYWVVYAAFRAAEGLLERALIRVPYYPHARLIFLLYLQWGGCAGAVKLYGEVLRPALVHHRPRIDAALAALSTRAHALAEAHAEDLRAVKEMAAYGVSVAQDAAVATMRALRGPR